MKATTIHWDSIVLLPQSHPTDQTDCGGTPEACLWEAINAWRTQRLDNVTDACPDDVSRTLHGFTIALNDCLPDEPRQRLKGYRDRMFGTNNQPGADQRAAYLSVDWLIRTYTPAFLRLAGLEHHADDLSSAPEIVDLTTLAGVTDHISAAYSAARSAADSAAYSAAYSAADSAAYSAARSAAYSAARSAADSAAYSAARSAAYSAARSAAYSAARSAADSAAEANLAPTVTALQASAFDLLDRMLDCYTVEATA